MVAHDCALFYEHLRLLRSATLADGWRWRQLLSMAASLVAIERPATTMTMYIAWVHALFFRMGAWHVFVCANRTLALDGR